MHLCGQAARATIGRRPGASRRREAAPMSRARGLGIGAERLRLPVIDKHADLLGRPSTASRMTWLSALGTPAGVSSRSKTSSFKPSAVAS